MPDSQLEEHLHLKPWTGKQKRTWANGQQKGPSSGSCACGSRVQSISPIALKVTLGLSACRGRKSDGVSTVTQPFPLKTQGNLKCVLADDLPSVRVVFIQGCAWKLSSFFYAWLVPMSPTSSTLTMRRPNVIPSFSPCLPRTSRP